MSAKEPSAALSLSSLWCSETNLECHHCKRQIHDSAPICTYQVVEQMSTATGMRLIAAQSRYLLLRYRHFECLIASRATFACISHVWNSVVTKVQDAGADDYSAESAEGQRALEFILTQALGIYDGISDASYELWFDYLSVPQWDRATKINLLLRIPDLYALSAFNIIHWHDVKPSAIKILLSPDEASSEERIWAITHVCNAHWFRRVWTGMEYVRSKQIRIMLKGHVLHEESDDAAHLFHSVIDVVWHKEATYSGRNQGQLEDAAGRGHMLLPWQISGLEVTRARHEKVEYAVAYECLSLRQCTNPMDFYYAMLGLVRLQEQLPASATEAQALIVRRCLEEQDWSPLIMIPFRTNDIFGFSNLGFWCLGNLVKTADTLLEVGSTEVKAYLRPIGRVTFLEGTLGYELKYDAYIFRQIARCVLAGVGPNVEDFVISLGCRCYGVNPHAILREIHSQGRYETLSEILRDLQRSHEDWPCETMDQLIEFMGLREAHQDQNRLAEHIRAEDLSSSPSFARSSDSYRLPATHEFAYNGCTIHGDDCSAIIGLQCPNCWKNIVARCAVYIPFSDARGVKAYRIPGLRYGKTLPDSICLLVRGRTIVGRLIYGVPCCSPGMPLEEVALDIPEIAQPTPNTSVYGGITDSWNSPITVH